MPARGSRLLLASLLAACSVPNPDHCSKLNGASTCQERGLGDYCSLCVAANDGCVDQPPSGDCIDTGPQTTTATTTSTATSTPVTTTTATTASPTTTTAATSSTDDTTTTTSSSSTSTADTGDTTAATTASGPTCGDDTRQPGEVCDGADLNGKDCTDANAKWGGGTLACNDDCQSFDQSMCCLNIGQTCNPVSSTPNETCCPGSTCDLLMCK